MVYIRRNIEEQLRKYQQIFPVIEILGPRQCGKSTLVRHALALENDIVYLDLQNLEDLNKLQDPYLFFKVNAEKTICLDEIQLKPELFSVLRSLVDQDRRTGRFILSGSASRNLVQQSAESLAGRIGYLSLTPFQVDELVEIPEHILWNRGGFPDSILANKDEFSYIWRENFIQTYVERDIPQLGIQIPALQLRRFLTICAHNQGQTLNLSKMGASMDMSHTTMRKYIDLLEQTFMLRTLLPYAANTKKRMVKSPKVYVRDSGILHALLGIRNMDMLLSHPVFGFSWEGLVIEQILSAIGEYPSFFYRTASGDEMDLLLEINGSIIAIECKASSVPKPSKGFYTSLKAVQASHAYIVAPISGDSYLLEENIRITGLREMITLLKSKI
jgi:uncharacterized protein